MKHIEVLDVGAHIARNDIYCILHIIYIFIHYIGTTCKVDFVVRIVQDATPARQRVEIASSDSRGRGNKETYWL